MKINIIMKLTELNKYLNYFEFSKTYLMDKNIKIFIFLKIYFYFGR